MGVVTAFSYKQGKTFLHKCPAWIKILLIPLISLLAFMLPPFVVIFLVAAQALLSFCLGISLREQLCDLRAILYYSAILLFAKLVSGNFSELSTTLFMLIKLFCVMQTASLVFKCSTSLQIRQGLESIELAVRRFFKLKAKAPISQTLSLFICFIPMVSKNWAQAKKAWYARGGKKSVRMLLVLLPVLFSVGIKEAYNSAKALTIRSKRDR